MAGEPAARSVSPARARVGALGLAIVVVGALVLAAGQAAERSGELRARQVSDAGLRGHVLPAPLPKPAFTLRDTRGDPFDFRAETEGALTLLFVGYTSCPDICPVHLANLAAVLADLPPEARDRVRVVFVTGDPERDTPERIRAWLDAFDPRFIGLRGRSEELDVVLSALGLPSVSRGAPDASGDYTVGHPAQILAFTPDGMLRVAYPFGTRQADWAHDLPRLLAVRFEPPLPEAVVEPSAGRVPAPPGDGPAALYLTLHNRSDRPDALIGASTPLAGRVELHRQSLRGGVTTMERVDEIPLPARETTRLAPGGHHLMLRDLTGPLVPGDAFTVELRFRRGGAVPTRAVVVPYAALDDALGGDPAHEGH